MILRFCVSAFPSPTTPRAAPPSPPKSPASSVGSICSSYLFRENMSINSFFSGLPALFFANTLFLISS